MLQILSYLQHQQEDSLGIEKKKLKKLTLILSFLAIIFAVRLTAADLTFIQTLQTFNIIITQVSSLPLNTFFILHDLGIIFIPDVHVRKYKFINQSEMPNFQEYYFILGICHLLSMSSCISNPILYGWLQA